MILQGHMLKERDIEYGMAIFSVFGLELNCDNKHMGELLFPWGLPAYS
jgi:hypothetical protein